MKYEQTVQVELQEYICMVKRIDGVVAQKALEQELIRCKNCKYYDSEHEVCCVYISYRLAKDANDYCSDAERKEE